MKGLGLLFIALIVGAGIIALAFANLNVGLLTQIAAENVLAGTFGKGNFTFQDDLVVGGNLTGNFIQGNMWNHNDTSFTVDLVTIMVYENVTNFTTIGNNGFTLQNNRSLLTSIAGLYKVDYSISFSGTANSEIGFAVGINGADQNQTHTHRTIGTGGDIGNSGGTGIIRLESNDLVSLMARDEQAPVRDIDIQAVNLVLIRVGD